MLSVRLNKVTPVVYTPPAVIHNTGPYMSPLAKRELMRTALDMPSGYMFDEDGVVNTGYPGLDNIKGYLSEDAYAAYLKELGQKYPVGTLLTSWPDSSPNRGNYDPIVHGFHFVMGYQTHYKKLLYETNGYGATQNSYPKGLIILSVPSMAATSNGIQLRFEPEMRYYKLSAEESKKVTELSQDDHVRFQTFLANARKLIDFHFQKEAKSFQEAIDECSKTYRRK